VSFDAIFSMAAAAGAAGLACGVACGACSGPAIHVMLSGYLLTHSAGTARSLLSFGLFFAGKAASAVLLCLIASLAGSAVMDDAGRLFGVNLRLLVRIAMAAAALAMIAGWFASGKKSRGKACAGCHTDATAHKGKAGIALCACGFLSGIAPCGPLVVVMGYSAALAWPSAIAMGIAFTLASSALPALLLALLAGALSGAMHRELQEKVRYFQLASYIAFALSCGYALFLKS